MRSPLLAPIFKLREFGCYHVWKSVSCGQPKSQCCFKSRTTTKEDLLIPSNKFVARLELNLAFCLMIFQLLHDIFFFFIDENVQWLFTANVT